MLENDTPFVFKKIATIQSCYQQKFTIPRQPGLVKEAIATIIFDPEFQMDIVRGLEQSSHIWVIFSFHKSQLSANRNTVRPPRLGGEKRLGVFATRSNYRPNGIGQSVVKLDEISTVNNLIHIKVSGGDFLDGTPVLDIKPYIPYADSVLDATSSFAPKAPEPCFHVSFETLAQGEIEYQSKELDIDLIKLISSLLAYDFRPNKTKSTQIYVTKIFHLDLSWRIENDEVIVISFRSG